MNRLQHTLINKICIIPHGRVITYGHLAQHLNVVTDATTSGRAIGRLLNHLTLEQQQLCPRWRVINKQGYISALKLGQKGLIQINHLKDEGILVSSDGYVDMARYERRFDTDII